MGDSGTADAAQEAMRSPACLDQNWLAFCLAVSRLLWDGYQLSKSNGWRFSRCRFVREGTAHLGFYYPYIPRRELVLVRSL
jgi:hypothetical protein